MIHFFGNVAVFLVRASIQSDVHAFPNIMRDGSTPGWLAASAAVADRVSRDRRSLREFGASSGASDSRRRPKKAVTLIDPTRNREMLALGVRQYSAT